MKRLTLLGALSAAACSSGMLGSNQIDGSADRAPTSGAAGAAGAGVDAGGAGTNGAAGAGGGGSGGTNSAAGAGGGGKGGSAGGSGGSGGTNGAAGAGGGGKGGSAGGSGGSAGGSGGSAGGSGGSAGGSGGNGGTNGAAGAGGGGSGGSAGSAGGSGGSAGSAGGSAGGSGGSGGSAGGGGPLHVSLAQVFPAVTNYIPLIGVAIGVDSQDDAVVVGPSAFSANDPGPAITWFTGGAVSRRLTYAHAPTPSAMSIDPSDSIWLVGHLESGAPAVDFGGGNPVAAVDGYYLAKLSSTGTQVILKAVAPPGSTFVQGMTTDGSGNVYVVGTRTPSGSSLQYAFVSKFSAAGDPVFDRAFPGTDTTCDPRDIAVAPNGDVIVVGQFNGSAQFGTIQLTSLGTAGGGHTDNGFLAVLGATDGTPKQAFSFGGTNGDYAAAIDVTASGAYRVSGYLSGTVTIGGMTLHTAAGGSGFVAELTPAGTANWALLGEGSSFLFQSDTNSAGRTFVVGRIDAATTSESIVGSVDSVGGGGGGPALTLPLRVRNDGNGPWHAAADHHGGVWVGGELLGTVNFGTGPITGPDATMPAGFLLHLEP